MSEEWMSKNDHKLIDNTFAEAKEYACPHCEQPGHIRRQYNNYLSRMTYTCLACARVTRFKEDLLVVKPPKEYKTLGQLLLDLDPVHEVEFGSDKGLPVIRVRQYQMSSIGTVLPKVIAAITWSCGYEDTEAQVLKQVQALIKQVQVVAKTANKGI